MLRATGVDAPGYRRTGVDAPGYRGMDRGVRGAFGEVVLDHEFHGWARMDSGGAGGFGLGACGLLRLMVRMKASSAWGLRFACEVGLGLGQRCWFDVFLTVASEVF